LGYAFCLALLIAAFLFKLNLLIEVCRRSRLDALLVKLAGFRAD
jgi:hypothetical protein